MFFPYPNPNSSFSFSFPSFHRTIFTSLTQGEGGKGGEREETIRNSLCRASQARKFWKSSRFPPSSGIRFSLGCVLSFLTNGFFLFFFFWYFSLWFFLFTFFFFFFFFFSFFHEVGGEGVRCDEEEMGERGSGKRGLRWWMGGFMGPDEVGGAERV